MLFFVSVVLLYSIALQQQYLGIAEAAVVPSKATTTTAASDDNGDSSNSNNGSFNPDIDCSSGYCPFPSSYPKNAGTASATAINGSKQQARARDGKDGDIDVDEEKCNIWLGPSPIKKMEQHGFGLGMFTGRAIPKGTTVESLYNTKKKKNGSSASPAVVGEIMLPIYGSESIWDKYHPPLREYVWDEDSMPEVAVEYPVLETAIFMSGLSAIAPCTSNNYNLQILGDGSSSASTSTSSSSRESIVSNNDGLARSAKYPTIGSFAYRHNVSYVAIRDIAPGEELTVQCSDDDYDGGAYYLSTFNSHDDAVVCLDQNLYVDKSTIVGAGRGVFAKRSLRKNSNIISTPMIPLKRNEMDITGEGYEGNVNTKQLMLNYCYGHPNSDLLLLPYGPLVNYINHGGDDKSKVNAKIIWHHERDGIESAFPSNLSNLDNDMLDVRQQHHHPELLTWPADVVARTHGKGLMIDIIATRDIDEDEEIFLDYGKEWQTAFEKHTQNWVRSATFHKDSASSNSEYMNADEYMNYHGNEKIYTLVEQENGHEYPNNMDTFCFYATHIQLQGRISSKEHYVDDNENDIDDDDEYYDENEDDDDDDDDEPTDYEYYSWNDDANHMCFRPCRVLSRYRGKNATEGDLYAIELMEYNNNRVVNHCEIDNDIIVRDVPKQAIRIVNKPFTTDVLLKNAFRHEIGVPTTGFYPDTWMKTKLRSRSPSTTASGGVGENGTNNGDEFKRKKVKATKINGSEGGSTGHKWSVA